MTIDIGWPENAGMKNFTSMELDEAERLARALLLKVADARASVGTRVAKPQVTTQCPPWCTDHADLSEGSEWMVEHRSGPSTSVAREEGYAPVDEPGVAEVWTAQWEDEDGPGLHQVVMEVPSSPMGRTALTALQAAALADHLRHAAEIAGG
jgi:hypothetical protein